MARVAKCGVGTLSISGSFPRPGEVTGAVAVSCTGVVVTFTQTTTLPPPPPPPPPPPASTQPSSPFFQGGHDSVKLVRGKTKGDVSVRARFRGCGGTGPFRLVVQRRRVGTAIAAESTFGKPLGAGTPAPPSLTTPCRDFAATWRLASKFFGAGVVVITLKIVDSGDRESLTPQYALRAPKR